MASCAGLRAMASLAAADTLVVGQAVKSARRRSVRNWTSCKPEAAPGQPCAPIAAWRPATIGPG